MLKLLASIAISGLDSQVMVEQVFRYSFGCSAVTFMIYGILVRNFSTKNPSPSHATFMIAAEQVLAAIFIGSIATGALALSAKAFSFVVEKF